MLAKRASFDDVNLHARAVQGWRQTYDQLGHGKATTRLLQLTTSHVQIFHETINIKVSQCGMAPLGRFSIAMPFEGIGSDLIQPSISVLRGGQEFFVQTGEKVDLIAVSVDEQRLRLLSEAVADPAKLTAIKPNLSLARQHQTAVCRQLGFLIGHGQHGTALSEKEMEDKALECILDVLELAVDRSRERGSDHAVSAYLVKRSQELALEYQQDPMSVLDICRHLNVSRRTLQRSFQQVTGIRPVEYLRTVRLNAVRRRLRATCLEQVSIAQAAVDQGFSHLGHFSGYYKALFAECPSHTRRAS